MSYNNYREMNNTNNLNAENNDKTISVPVGKWFTMKELPDGSYEIDMSQFSSELKRQK